MRIPEFANLMRTDNKPIPKTYSVQSTHQKTTAKNEGKILSESSTHLEKPNQSSSANMTQNISQKVNPPPKNLAV